MIGRVAPSPETQKLIRAHTVAAFVGLMLSALFGLVVSIKFHAPAFLGGHGWDTWGRLRYDHTQGILYAWLGNAFIAFLYYAVPILARREFTSVRLGWLMFWTWNVVAVLGGWSLVLAGRSQPLEWAEFPLAIAAVIELSFLFLIIQFGLPSGRVAAPGYMWPAGICWAESPSLPWPIPLATFSPIFFPAPWVHLSAACGFTMLSGCSSRPLPPR
jgi:hypothetical protein